MLTGRQMRKQFYELWGLSGSVVEAIGFHHRIREYSGTSVSSALGVHVVNALYYEQRPDEIIGAAHLLDYEYWKKWVLAGELMSGGSLR
jgi:hypothetical protein